MYDTFPCFTLYHQSVCAFTEDGLNGSHFGNAEERIPKTRLTEMHDNGIMGESAIVGGNRCFPRAWFVRPGMRKVRAITDQVIFFEGRDAVAGDPFAVRIFNKRSEERRVGKECVSTCISRC